MQSQDGKLSLKEGQASRHANVSDGLRVQQAMSRRAAAAEIAGIATFDALQKWHTYLLNTLTQQPPQGFTPVALEQLTAADKELWMGVSHKVGASLPSDHDFPVDQAIQELMLTPPVAMTQGGNGRLANELERREPLQQVKLAFGCCARECLIQ